MTKNKFAGLAEAKMKALDTEGQVEEKQDVTSTEKPEKKKTVKLANKQASKLANKAIVELAPKRGGESEPLVGVTIKIPEEKRIWWNVQAKLQRTTVTDAIIEALDKRFGEPNF